MQDSDKRALFLQYLEVLDPDGPGELASPGQQQQLLLLPLLLLRL